MKDLRPMLGRLGLRFLPLAAVATALALTTYGAVQQSLRGPADDPQIAMAEDAAAALAAGQAMAQVVPAVRAVPIARSVAPFVIAYGEDRQTKAATGTFDGVAPLPPAGVFAYAKEHGEDRLTWMPRPDVRLATVVVHYDGQGGSGYVLAARSLREVEARIDRLGKLVALGWMTSLLAGAAALALAERLRRA